MGLDLRNVAFHAAYGTPDQLPPATLPEVAFVGRSNVGKSSLMNKLFGRRGLVKVSSTPGKTATVNFFSADAAFFVDLPGYGYAKAGKDEQARLAALIEGYLRQERRTALVVSLIDIRHDASKLDLEMVSLLEELGLPYVVAFTKSDKLSRSQQQRQTRSLCAQLAGVGCDAVVVACSSASGQGIDDIRAVIDDALAQA